LESTKNTALDLCRYFIVILTGGQHLFTVYFFLSFLLTFFLFIWSSNLRQRIGKIKNPPKAITDKMGEKKVITLVLLYRRNIPK
jgi:hypothetical protein